MRSLSAMAKPLCIANIRAKMMVVLMIVTLAPALPICQAIGADAASIQERRKGNVENCVAFSRPAFRPAACPRPGCAGYRGWALRPGKGGAWLHPPRSPDRRGLPLPREERQLGLRIDRRQSRRR